MYLTPYTRKSDATKLRSDIDRVFDTFLTEPFTGWSLTQGDTEQPVRFLPKLEVSETPKELLVKAELPGVDPAHVDVSLSEGILTIRGEKQAERTEEQKGFYHSERSYGSFMRQVQLPNTIDSDAVNAEFKNGLLTVRLGKARGAEPKKVPISAK